MYYYEIENLTSMHLLTGEPTADAKITESKTFKRYGKALGEGLKAMYALVIDDKKTYGLVLRVFPRISNQRCLFYCDVTFDNHGGNLNVHSFLNCDGFTIPQEVLEVERSYYALISRTWGSLYRQFKDAKKFAKAIDDAERNIEK